MSETAKKLSEMIAAHPKKLRIKLIREYHTIAEARAVGISWPQIAKSIGGPSPDVVRRGWVALQAAISSGRINPASFEMIDGQPRPSEAQPDAPPKAFDLIADRQTKKRLTAAEALRLAGTEGESETTDPYAEVRSKFNIPTPGKNKP